MKNIKIPMWVGTSIIVIFTIMVSAFVWKYEKNKLKSEIKNTKQHQQEESSKAAASYKNITYNYEMEIPSDFDAKTGSTKNPDSLINIISKKDKKPLFSVNVEPSKFKNIDNWLSDYQQKLSKITSYEGVKINPPSILSNEKASVDGTEAIKVTVHNMPYSNYLVVFIKDKFIYTISYNGLFLEDEEKLLEDKPDNQVNMRYKFQSQYRMELDKIVSSFRFIK